MDRVIKSQDGYLWMNVTDKAQQLFDAGIFPLQEVWFREEDNSVLRIPIETQEDLNRAIEMGRYICMFVGQIHESISLGFVTQDSWTAADKISHDGFTYVRFKDLVFCK